MVVVELMDITNKLKKNTISFRYLIIGIVVVSLLIITFFAVDKQWFFSDDQEREKLIKQVLNEQFSTADEALIRLMESPENATILDDTGKAIPEGDTALNDYLQEKYSAYFTKEMYQEYLTTYAFMYQVPAYYANVSLQAADISLEKNDTEASLYNFTVSVSYGESQEAVVKGRARVNDTKKLSYFKILEDDGLHLAISNEAE